MQEIWSLGWEGPLEEEMSTHSSILGWRIPWREEPATVHRAAESQLAHTRKGHILKKESEAESAAGAVWSSVHRRRNWGQHREECLSFGAGAGLGQLELPGQHTLGGLTGRNLRSHTSGGWRSETRVPVWWGSGGSSLCGLQTAAFSAPGWGRRGQRIIRSPSWGLRLHPYCLI